MEKITLSCIKADVGGYVGHGEVHPDMLQRARELIGELLDEEGEEIELRPGDLRRADPASVGGGKEGTARGRRGTDAP
jgi:hypothetical protein